MADQKFSDRPLASVLSGTETAIGLQGGAAVQIPVQALADLPSATKAVAGEIVGVNAQVGTAYALVAGDKGKLIVCSNANPVTVTVPQGIFKAKAVIYLKQAGAGQVQFSAASGVTLETASSLKTRVVRSVIALIFHADDQATCVGDMA